MPIISPPAIPSRPVISENDLQRSMIARLEDLDRREEHLEAMEYIAESGTTRALWGYPIEDHPPEDGEVLMWDDDDDRWEPTAISGTVPRSLTLALNSFTTSRGAAIANLVAHGTTGAVYAPYAWMLDLDFFVEINIRFRLPLDWHSGAISCSIDYDSAANSSEDPAMRIYWAAISAGESTVADPALIASDTLSVGMAQNILYQHTFSGTITPTAEEMIHLSLRSEPTSVSASFLIYIYGVRINYTGTA